MAADFVGAGWSFPVRMSPTGGVQLSTGDREIMESIRLILSTAPGERPMRPEFGCAIHRYVFAPANQATAGDMAHAVRLALERWEVRIELEDVRVLFDRAEEGVLGIEIGYRLRGTNDPRNLVFPFYVIPQHEGDAA